MNPRISHSRRGAMSVIMAVMLMTMLMLSAFAIGVSQIQLARNEALIVADCASLSAASIIGEQTDDPSLSPESVAQSIVALNQIGGKSAAVSTEDVIMGTAKRNSVGNLEFVANKTDVNAVRVNVRLDDGAGMAKQSYLFPFLGSVKAFRVGQHSVSAKVGVDIALVIDRSSSMNNTVAGLKPPIMDPEKPFAEFYPHPSLSRWAGVLQSIGVLFNELRSNRIDESVALVTFGSDRAIVLNGEDVFFPGSRVDVPFTTSFNTIETTLNRMWDVYPMISGQTWIDYGIDDATAILTEDTNRSFAAKIMVVLTDGNQHPISLKHYDAAERAASKGITIHTIAYSEGAGMIGMMEVAKIGGGQAFKANNNSELRKAFAEIGKLAATAIVE